jgi:hypothetical protein
MKRGFTTIEIITLITVLFAGFGWIWNVVKIAQTGFDTLTGMFIARCIGVFVAPLGAVLGYF